MATIPMTVQNDDPRKLRNLIERAGTLARQHDVPSVVVGLAAGADDLSFPDFIDYLQAVLRVEDGIFRMTRDRAVLHLADVEPDQAREVVERLYREFADEYPARREPGFRLRMLAIVPDEDEEPSVKAVLKALFDAEEELPSIH